MLVPVTAEAFCAVQAGEVHAAAAADVRARIQRGRRTLDTLCGLRRARLLVAEVTDPDGGVPWNQMALVWPPPAVHDGRARCRDYWDATGRRRPHPTFRDLREQAARTEAVA